MEAREEGTTLLRHRRQQQGLHDASQSGLQQQRLQQEREDKLQQRRRKQQRQQHKWLKQQQQQHHQQQLEARQLHSLLQQSHHPKESQSQRLRNLQIIDEDCHDPMTSKPLTGFFVESRHGCHSYVMCMNGSHLGTFWCPEGLLCAENDSTCILEGSVVCGTDGSALWSDEENEGETSGVEEANNANAENVNLNLPPTKFPSTSPTKSSTNAKEALECRNPQTSRPLTGYYIRPHYGCQHYMYCSNGNAVQYQTCPDGLLFDATTLACSFADGVVCDTDETGLVPTTSPVSASNVAAQEMAEWKAPTQSPKISPLASWSLPTTSPVVASSSNEGNGSSTGIEQVAVAPQDPQGASTAGNNVDAASNVNVSTTTSSTTTAGTTSSSPKPKIKGTVPPTQKSLLGYYASWQWYDREKHVNPLTVNYSQLTRINYAFFQPSVDGEIFGTDSWGDPQVLFGPYDWSADPSNTDAQSYKCSWDKPNEPPNCAHHKYQEGLLHQAKQNGVEVYVSIGGWTLSDNFSKMAENGASRVRFARNCARIIREYGFDGIDIGE